MTAEFHKANRQRLYAEMKDGSTAVFFSGSAPRQSADAYYTFFTNRRDSSARSSSPLPTR